MWWSKHSESSSFSPSSSSTLTIDPPVDTHSIPATHSKRDRAAKGAGSSTSDLRLDDVVEGSIYLNCRRLTIGETAKAAGSVIAREVIVYGELAGHLQAAEGIEIRKNGSVRADVTTRRIVIEEGAYFKGTVQIERRRRPRTTAKARF